VVSLTELTLGLTNVLPRCGFMLPSSEGAKYLLPWLQNQGYKDIKKSSSKGAKYLLPWLQNQGYKDIEKSSSEGAKYLLSRL